MQATPNYDVTIVGGGLASLCLSLQLKQEMPNISILVLEKRGDVAPSAAHKVGESTVELATYYLREILHLKDYLDQLQLPKHGLRFFFSTNDKSNLANRVELGPKDKPPVPSHQLDRGILENELTQRSIAAGNQIILGAKGTEVKFGTEHHDLSYETAEGTFTIKSKWIVDGSGRASFLKRKLGLKKDNTHNVNAAWFRIDEAIDVDDWSENTAWKKSLTPGARMLGTVHMIDKGYWFWIIPLVSQSTSFGIVADPRFHPFESFNTFDKAMDWLKINEPLAHEKLLPKKDLLLDFKILKKYSYNCEEFFSTDRWALVGEAGAFMDPFYSPGSDFIAIGNTMTTDLILRDLRGEDITIHTTVYERTYSTVFNNWLPIYLDKYQLMGNPQTMILKILWDFSTYWAIPVLLFFNKGFTNIQLIRTLSSGSDGVLRRYGPLNESLQNLLVEWVDDDTTKFTNEYVDPLSLSFLKQFHHGIEAKLSDDAALESQLIQNVELLERVLCEIFRKIYAHKNGSCDFELIDPYHLSINPEKYVPATSESDHAWPKDEMISAELDQVWFYEEIVA